MPCIYAHNSFGKEVQKYFPNHLKIPFADTLPHSVSDCRDRIFIFYHPLLKCKTNQLGLSPAQPCV